MPCHRNDLLYTDQQIIRSHQTIPMRRPRGSTRIWLNTVMTYVLVFKHFANIHPPNHVNRALFVAVMSTKLTKVKWLKIEVTCKDHTLGHGKPGSKGTLTFEIVVINHRNHRYISTYYLAQLNKSLSNIVLPPFILFRLLF
jgi:hypothetical protein